MLEWRYGIFDGTANFTNQDRTLPQEQNAS